MLYAEVTQSVSSLNNWKKLDGKFIVKKHRVREFLKGIAFVQGNGGAFGRAAASSVYF